MRVRRCFSFLDLCGFTAYTEGEGDTQAVAVLASLRATLRASCEEHGVRVTKWLGDGVMLSGLEADDVVACSAEVRDLVSRHGILPLRGGICVGDVIMFEGDDYVGASVNVAARLCAIAAPDEVLIALHGAPDCPAVRDGGPPRVVAVPGISGTVEVRALAAAPRLRAVPDAGSAGAVRPIAG